MTDRWFAVKVSDVEGALSADDISQAIEHWTDAKQSEVDVVSVSERTHERLVEVAEASNQPSPTFWPGENDHEATGPIGDGTPHARMQWFWERMTGQKKLIEELTGWSPVSSSYRFEAAVADAFDRLAEGANDA